MEENKELEAGKLTSNQDPTSATAGTSQNLASETGMATADTATNSTSETGMATAGTSASEAPANEAATLIDSKKQINKIILAAAALLLAVLVFFCGQKIGSGIGKNKSGELKTASTDTNQSSEADENADGSQGTSGGADDSSGTDGESNSDDNNLDGNDNSASETGTGADSGDDNANTNTGTNNDNNSSVNNDNSSEADGSELTVTVSTTGSWGESPVYTQLAIVIINKTSNDLDGWTLEINVGDGAAVDSGWNGEFSIEDGIMTVKNVDYNSLIYAGGTCELGVILSGITGDLLGTAVAGGIYSEPVYDSSNSSNNNSSSNDSNSNQNNSQTTVNATALEVPEPTTDDWLHTDGNKIYDSEGKEVWLTGVNWFGYNTGTNTFDGLWTCDLNTSLQAIANHGFNLLRVPISAELILNWKDGTYPEANFNQATNSYLVGMNSLEIFDYIIGQCRANGIKIMIDIHSAETNASGHTVNLWCTDNITVSQYQAALVWMAERYANDDTIIAYDLKNEPHGKPYEGALAAIWNNSKSANNWKYVAEQTALKVLAKNPNVLIMVEGIEIYPIDITANGDYSSTDSDDYYFNWWGGNLRGVADYPINLGKYQNKLVYSPHDYGPTVYEQPWFEGDYDFDSLMEDCWEDNWFYIYEDEIAPLLIGEWGGYMTEPNITWMTYMRQLISENHLNHTFWCFNSNSGDTGGLVLDDFTTWDEDKYEFVKEVLWQEDGKFVGLDHQIPLGTAGNGITLSAAKGL